MTSFILHCDLDCFYASVEVRDNPDYKGLPVIVGSDPKGGTGRGVVSTCNYEARIFGLHSGMPISLAYRNCPHGIYLRPSRDKYNVASKQVMKIISSYSEIFQKVGLDEAYLDVSSVCRDWKDVKILAEKIQKDVFQKIGITISIGCATTKSLAKIASDFNKPHGITIFTQFNFKDMIKDLDITRVPGIGKKSKVHYHNNGIKQIKDILNLSLPRMRDLFGKHGFWAWKVVNGLDKRRVREKTSGRKSMSQERTFNEDTGDSVIIMEKFREINEKLHKSFIKHNLTCKTITLKIRFEGFITYTRSNTLLYPIQDKLKVLEEILKLYEEFKDKKEKVRLLGIKLSNLEKTRNSIQTSIINFAHT